MQKTGGLGVEPLARDAGVSPTKARTLNRLADLIPALMTRLDAHTITQKMAYGFAQRPAGEQEKIAALLAARTRNSGS